MSSNNIPALIPAQAGTYQASPPPMKTILARETVFSRVYAFAGAKPVVGGVLAAWTRTRSSGRPHDPMTVAQVAHHIATSPDHLLRKSASASSWPTAGGSAPGAGRAR